MKYLYLSYTAICSRYYTFLQWYQQYKQQYRYFYIIFFSINHIISFICWGLCSILYAWEKISGKSCNVLISNKNKICYGSLFVYDQQLNHLQLHIILLCWITACNIVRQCIMMYSNGLWILINTRNVMQEFSHLKCTCFCAYKRGVWYYYGFV